MARQTNTTDNTDSTDTNPEIVEPRKRYNVTGTIDPELYDKAEDYRWANRMKMSELVSEAIKFFVESKSDGNK